MNPKFEGIKKRNFGIEIEMTGLTRQQAAQAVGKLFGTEFSHYGGYYDRYSVKDAKGRKWEFVFDGSIQRIDKHGNPADSAYSVELNSPVLGYEDIPLLQEVVRTLRRAGGKCSPEYKCGTHIHISADDFTPQQINYPLMQGEDNEFYLHHAYDGSHLSAGSVFLDCRCSPNFMNPINVVYAHNMKNGSMFAGLINFKNSEYFESHRCGWLATSDKVYRIDFFSLAVADWHDSVYDGSQPVSGWMNRIQNLSQIFEGISYDENDKFISLSTCSSEFQNARTVLTGRLVEMNGGENDS